MSALAFGRVLLKLSGEVLADPGKKLSISPLKAGFIIEEVKQVLQLGVEIGVVIGGGNILRGATEEGKGIDRSVADYVGMLATVMNGLVMQDLFVRSGVDAILMSALDVGGLAQKCIPQVAISHLQNGAVVIFAGGTGNPYFSTDTAAALRALEIHADVVLKGTKVDGIYDSDPAVTTGATRYDQLTYMDVLSKGLKIMDSSAITMCMDANIPIIVFNIFGKGELKKVVMGQKTGTRVYGETT